jgi:hypothetical protein
MKYQIQLQAARYLSTLPPIIRTSVLGRRSRIPIFNAVTNEAISLGKKYYIVCVYSIVFLKIVIRLACHKSVRSPRLQIHCKSPD